MNYGALLESLTLPTDSGGNFGLSFIYSDSAVKFHKVMKPIATYKDHSFTNDDLESRFNSFVEQWEKDTDDLSSLTQIVANQAYLSIIGMGKSALPFIFRELEYNPNYWFTALKSILSASGEGEIDPVPPAYRGNLDKMTDAWIEWGKQEGYC